MWTAVAAAGLVALISPFAFRPVLTRLGVLDVPNGRSSHSRPTLRGGGVAPLLGLVAVIVVMVVLAQPTEGARPLAVVFGAGLLAGLLGLAEDVRGLRTSVRAAAQFLIGLTVAAVFLADAGGSLFWLPVAALFFAANVNFTNFMDGVNAISSLHGFVVGGTYALLGTVTSLPWLTLVGLVIAVCYLAFLPWNLTPPGVFLGDVGSYLLGGLIGAAALAALSAGVNPVASLAPLTLYWADTVSTLVRRATRGEPVFHAHRTHAYQRLTNTQLSHVTVAHIVALFTLFTGVIGVLIQTERLAWPMGLLAILGAGALYLALPRLRGDQLPSARQQPLADVPFPKPSASRPEWAPKRWAVLGASGFIGRAVVEHLERQGYEVVQLKAPRLTLDPAISDGVVVAELAEHAPETARLAESLRGIDVVVNAAGLATPDGSASPELYGANALLPAVLVCAANRAGVGRVIHLSSAAVQGDRAVLDATPEVSPFSPYSRSKALGERGLLAAAAKCKEEYTTQSIVLRATSVQGIGRGTTEMLRRVAASPLASVAAPGDHATVVSSVKGLAAFVHEIGSSRDGLEPILLQPWEGLSVSDVLRLAGGRDPVVLPRWLCRIAVSLGKVTGRCLPKIAGISRRVEVMWFGQAQRDSGLSNAGKVRPGGEYVRELFEGGGVNVS